MDSGRAPSIIQKNQVAHAINLTFRGGFPTTRPGWKKLPLNFQSDATVQGYFEDGRFQCSEYFDPSNAEPELAVSISGRLFIVRVADGTNTVLDVSIPTDLNLAAPFQAWMVQAEDFLLVQDGINKALVFDGSSTRRAGATEVPVGSVMAYGMGRLWVASGKQFYASDLVYSSSGTVKYSYRDAVLKFTENDFLAGGGAFTVPVGSGDITAMQFMANLDTSLGQGPLQVFTPNTVFSINVPVDRLAWQSVTYPVQSVSQIQYGAMGPKSAVLVNGDIWYRSRDGIRSFVIARRNFEAAGSWGNTPVSSEVGRLLDDDDQYLLTNGSGVLFDNRLLMTCSPARSFDHGVYHRGITALDFNLISGLQGKAPPAYDGLWTGLNVLQLVKGEFQGKERCFAFVLSSANKIELWELTQDLTADYATATPTRIQASFESRSMAFLDNGQELKQLATGDLWLDQISGEASIAIQYRPDQYPFWQSWHSWTVCAGDTCNNVCGVPTTIQQQYRPRVRFPVPSDDCNEMAGTPYRLGYEFQVRFSITGHARLKQFRIAAYEQQEEALGYCPTDDACSTLTGCDSNPFTYAL